MRPLERFAVGLAAAGVALALLDVLAPPWRGWYVGSPAQAGLHVLVAGAGVTLLLLEARGQAAAARGVGIALLGLAAVGTLAPGLAGAGAWMGLRLEALENLAHALAGAWGAWVART